ncbi:hypothetical protein FLL45_17900 [Aliikangiella marina]|uniref:Uncharacterized protein n=1 Tax=Aliikangiella marina TaxID=1712262 RepID=A0A545T4E4_9GAMM|nr:hypothetical protein [Aliikangiella marina]TQV72096.1 hypothetical protein FLL45_17900 [Aliikangiella marina]
MIKNNKILVLLHFAVIVFTCYVIYLRFIRYILADNESIAIAMLNPSQLPVEQPGLFSGLMILLVFLTILLLKIKANASLIFRLIKGLYGYSIVLLMIQLVIVLGSKQLPKSWTSPVYESKHLFVEVVTNQTRLRESPSLDSKILRTLDAGTLLLLNDVKKDKAHTWNRVLLAPKEYAWIVRVANVGDNSRKRLSKTNKFYFTVADQYSLFIALIGFLWGFITVKAKH